MDRKEILETAEKMVNGARQDDYGKPERSFEMIAALWSIYLKYRIRITSVNINQTSEGIYRVCNLSSLSPQDVAAMMILLKIARVAGGHGKSDNWIDIAGYAACGGELDAGTKEGKATRGEDAEQIGHVDWNSIADRYKESAKGVYESIHDFAEAMKKKGEVQ